MDGLNLKIERRGEQAFLLATGDDLRFSTRLAEPLTGPLVVELKARPAKGVTSQFFWAPLTGSINGL